jgi:glycerophosphoryl diester phosphodiesterase
MFRTIPAILAILLLGGGCMTLTPKPPDPGPAPISRNVARWGDLGPRMVAHRCGAGLGPENTLGALVQASFYRPGFYEVDIRHTRDGVPVCMHDDTIDRTTNLSGAVSDLTWEQIEEADAGRWFDESFTDEKVPTLDRMLDCANPNPLLIELKEADITPERCKAISDMLVAHNDISSVIISFHRSALETYRAADPDRRTGYLVRGLDDYALEGPHEMVGIAAGGCTLDVVNRLNEAGKVVNVYTVNEDFDRFIEMGVDLITTNYPDRLRKALPPG